MSRLTNRATVFRGVQIGAIALLRTIS